MRRFSCLWAGSLLFLSASVSADIIEVPTDEPTIQAGINAAANGDTVLVEDGYYFENCIIHGKAITLASRFLLDDNTDHIVNTVIDGSQPNHPDTASCVIIYEAATTGTVVTGLTLTNGRGTVWYDHSFGYTYREGAGILCDLTTVRIQNNLIIGNRVVNTSTPVASTGGGGIRFGWSPSAPGEIIGNVIAWNDAKYGGGIHFFQSQGIIKGNVIFANSGGQDFGGAGMFVWENPILMEIMNNTVVRNSSSRDGGGISLKNCPADLQNNIFRGNTAAFGNPQVQLLVGTGDAFIAYNNVQGGLASGNIDADPLFLNNFLLGPGSPSIDAGNPAASFNDIEDPMNPGNPLAPSLGTLRNDQGAYGGPNAFAFPVFTNPEISAPSEIDFGVNELNVPHDTQAVMIKRNMGQVTVTAVTFAGPHAAQFTRDIALPFRTGTSSLDSLRSFAVHYLANSVATLDDTMKIFHDDSTTASPLIVLLKGTTIASSCCNGSTGNVDCDGSDGVDVSDLTTLIDNLFISFTPLCCTEEANCDGDLSNTVDVSDLTKLIDNLFISFNPLPSCA